MSISLGGWSNYLITLCLCALPPSHPQSIRPDIPVNALPYASQAHLRHICEYYICLFSAATMPSPISECSLFAFVATTGSDFHLFIYARDLSTSPSRDERRRWFGGGSGIENHKDTPSQKGAYCRKASSKMGSQQYHPPHPRQWRKGVKLPVVTLNDDEEKDVDKVLGTYDDKFGARGCLCWIEEEMIDGSASCLLLLLLYQ